MPTWSGILDELRSGSSYDEIRRKYLAELYTKTKRPTILYASGWLQKPYANTPETNIFDEDVHGFMEVAQGLDGECLDLILHSPGGSPAAAEAIVIYLRSKFQDIRVIVPHQAMSAATMLACAADRLLMGNHSFLGPIDPQLMISTPTGPRMAPAQAILDQFDLAVAECKDPTKLAAWLPMLGQYGPDLLVQCKNACDLSQELARCWLQEWMFGGDGGDQEKAAEIAQWLGNHNEFKAHGRPIGRSTLESKGMKVEALESDQALQDLVLSVFHATIHTLTGTPALKIIENHLGKAFIKNGPSPSPLPKAPKKKQQRRGRR